MQVALLTPDELTNIISEAYKRGAEDTLLTINNSNQKDEYLSASGVAKLLKCSPKTVYNWQAEGKLIKYLIGGKALYLRSEIMKAAKPI